MNRNEKELSVQTPEGLLKARVLEDDEYPGIALVFAKEGSGEPGAVMEYSQADKTVRLAVYPQEHPDDDPSLVLDMVHGGTMLDARDDENTDRFLLVSTCERDIYLPKVFEYFDDAYETMKHECLEACRLDEDDDDFGGCEAGMDENSAWCENANHDNCDWKIFRVHKEKGKDVILPA